jgi:UDP-N-acetylglucosamine:LPS N-acetylglucosamine transferase
MWVHPDVDLHLGIHDPATAEARGYGVRAVTVRPVVPPTVTDARHPADPLGDREVVGPVALLVGGSLGIGELEEATYDVLASGVMTPVVLCGTNEALRARLESVPGVVALGWRDDVPDLIAASACVVQNGGGFTTLEALGVGTPLVSYRPIPGHGLANAAALEAAGLAPWARTPAELRQRLLAALVAPHRSRLPVAGPSLVEVLTGATAVQAVA